MSVNQAPRVSKDATAGAVSVPPVRRWRSRQLRRAGLAAALVAATIGAGACTPKPQGADDAAEKFAAALSDSSTGSVTDAAQLTDNKKAAEADLDSSFTGLQASKLKASVKDVHTNGDVSTVTYQYAWQLPKDRHLTYTATATMGKSGSQWKVRWKPAVIHPDLGSNQHLELRSVAADRAPVVGSDGQVLLEPGTHYRVLLTKHDAATITQVANSLAVANRDDNAIPTINVDEVRNDTKDVDGKYSLTFIPSTASQLANQLKAIDGVEVNEEPALVRPDPSFAPDILSRVANLVNDDLDGKDGWQVATVNENGSVIKTIEQTDPTPAESVKISLNKTIQQAAQDAVNTRQETEAMMVVIRPSTGEVLAVAQTANADKKGDLALSGLFPPGSTFKIITATAGMEHQELTPDSSVPCPGTMDIGHRVVHNYNDFSLGTVPMLKAFAQSCNTTFANISSTLEPGVLKGTAEQFGLGQDYTIDGLDTITGQVPQGDELVDRVEGGFGQGKDLASPFGMALVAATAAAGHTPVPTLIESHETKVKDSSVQPPTPEAIDGLRSMMRAVVTGGTASAISGEGEIYGKTGEAEVADGSHAWFAGYRGDLAFATLIPLGGGSEHSVAITQKFFQEIGDKY